MTSNSLLNEEAEREKKKTMWNNKTLYVLVAEGCPGLLKWCKNGMRICKCKEHATYNIIMIIAYAINQSTEWFSHSIMKFNAIRAAVYGVRSIYIFFF